MRCAAEPILEVPFPQVVKDLDEGMGPIPDCMAVHLREWFRIQCKALLHCEHIDGGAARVKWPLRSSCVCLLRVQRLSLSLVGDGLQEWSVDAAQNNSNPAPQS